MFKHGLVVCIVIVCSCFVVVNAATFINFESPTYTVNSFINGQDGWTGPVDRVYIRYNSVLGSNVVDFNDAVGTTRYISRNLNNSYSNGKIRIEFLMKWLTDLSGEVILKDSANNWFFSFGIGKNYLQSGLYWQIGEGPAGYIANANNLPGGNPRFIQIRIDIDLDENLADVYWGEIGQAKTSIFMNYGINSNASISKIDLGNSISAAKFDELSVNAPTSINFESPSYTVNSLINGQDGWTGPSDRVYIKYNSALGSNVVDFNDAVGTARYISRNLNARYGDGKVRVEFLMKWLGDLSGEIILKDSSNNWIFSFGLGKNYLRSGLYWQIGEGPAGYVADANNLPTGNSRFIQIRIDVDLDKNLADVAWGEIGQSKITIFRNYEINQTAVIAKLDLGNSTSAAKFDNVSAFVNSPTFIDFDSSCYIIDSLINGQDGWSGQNGYIRYNSSVGSNVLDFNDSVGLFRYVSRALDSKFVYNDGKARIEFLMKWLGDFSGEVILKDSDDDWIFSFGIGKNYLQSGLYWQIGEGPAGYIANANNLPGGNPRFIQIRIDIDFDENLADVSWGEIGQAKINIFNDYAINSNATFAKIDLGNSTSAAKFDNISIDQPALPSDDGYRIFITKVYPGHGVLSSSDFKQLADAGFTAIVDRWQDDLPGFIEGAAVVELDSMTWDLGLVWGSGLPCTVTYEGKQTGNAVAYSSDTWSIIREMILDRVELSLTYPSFKAVLLDFEIYDPNKTNGYAESYDDYIFVQFLVANSLTVPNPLPAPAGRRSYLDIRGLLDDFIAYQYDMVAAEVLQIRQEIDAINPYFQIGVYGWGPLIEAVKENIASEVAPVLVLDATTYTRSPWVTGGYDVTTPDRDGLRWSMVTNYDREQVQKAKNYPAVYLGGHDPQTVGDGDLYKFTVRQAFNSYVYGSGYWVWTEWDAPSGWEKQAWINVLMAYFKKSQNAIDNMDWTWSSKEPDQIADINATVPKIILTRGANGIVTAWDPLTGLTTSPGVSVSWGTTAAGDVDAIDGDEFVDIESGWIRIFDETTDAPLLKFFVGADQTQMQLITKKFGDGFECNFNMWTDGGVTDWDRATDQKHTGIYAARCGSADNNLTSDNINTSGYASMVITIWYRDHLIDDDDNVYLQLYNGSSYSNKFELGITSPEDTWHQYTTTIYNSGSDAQYFRSNFRIRVAGASIDSSEYLWVDDVSVVLNY